MSLLTIEQRLRWLARQHPEANEVLVSSAEAIHLLERLDTLDAGLDTAREQEQMLRDALDATWEDVSVLLDHHASAEVEMEARRRLIERFAAEEKA